MTDSSKKEGSKWYDFSNILAVIMAAFVITMFFSPNLKGYVIQGLMKVGLYQPDIPHESIYPKQSNMKDAAFKDQQGNTVQLSDLKGKVVFLNFWATWCPPCIAEMPSINKLHTKYIRNNNVAFLLVDVDGKLELSTAFMKNRRFGLPVYVPVSAMPTAYFSGSMPTTVILDKSGNIVYQHIGAADYNNVKFKEFIDKLEKAKL
jgi:thiol-disulfide isomerase/thioredoxin